MTGLNSLGWQIHVHLKAHRPKMFRELKRLGTLNATVLRMQTQASNRMQALGLSGWPSDRDRLGEALVVGFIGFGETIGVIGIGRDAVGSGQKGGTSADRD